MTALYPGSTPNFTQQVDGTDIVNAADVNTAYDEITAIAVELGSNPSDRAVSWGTNNYTTASQNFGTVSARIQNVEDGVQAITGSAVTSAGNKTITVVSDSHVSLTVRAKEGQTANLLEAKSHDNTVVTAITPAGYIAIIDGGSA